MSRHTILPLVTMAESESRFRRTIRCGKTEESVDLLTLALKKDAEYDKVGTRIGVADVAGNVSRFPRSHILREAGCRTVRSVGCRYS